MPRRGPLPRRRQARRRSPITLPCCAVAPPLPCVQCLSAAQVQAEARAITTNSSWVAVLNCIEYTTGKRALPAGAGRD